MALRSLLVKIGADTQEIDKSLAKVGESAKSLQQGLKKLGDTPIGKQTQQDAERLQKSLEAVTASTKRLADQGVLAAKGIEAVGGPARLTSNQLATMNRTIQDSLDAFRALGQDAPKELQKVAKAIEAQQKALNVKPVQPSTFKQDLLSGIAGNLPGSSVLTAGLSGGTIAAVTAGATAGAAAFALAARQALNYADSLTKLSDKTGIGTESLQRLEAIASASGNTLDDVAKAVNVFQKNIAGGDVGASQAIREIGLSIANLKALSPDEQFIAIAHGIQSIKDPAEQTRVAMELFGKSGAELLPSLKSNVDALKDSTTVMSAESVQALDDFGDGLSRVATNATHFFGEIAGKAISATSAVLGLVKAVADAAVPPAANTSDQLLRQEPRFASSRVGPVPGVQTQFPTPPTSLPLAEGLKPLAPLLNVSALSELDKLNAALRETSDSFAGLTDAQKRAALVGFAHGESVSDVTKRLQNYWPAIDAASVALGNLFENWTKSNEAAKKFQAALTELLSATGGFGAALDSVDGSVVEAVKFYLDAGVAQNVLAEAYGLTNVQIKAIVSSRELDAKLIALNTSATLANASALTSLGRVETKELDTLRESQAAREAMKRAMVIPPEVVANLQRIGQIDIASIPALEKQVALREQLRKLAQNPNEVGSFNQLGVTNLPSVGTVVPPLTTEQLERLARADRAARELDQGLDAVAKDFALLAQIAGPSLSGIVRALGSVVAGVKTMRDSLKEITDAKTLFGKLSGAAGFIGAGIEIGQTLVQGIEQALKALERSRIAHDVGRDLGVAITDGTAEAIRQHEATLRDAFTQSIANSVGDPRIAKILARAIDPKAFREQAIALSLPDIISDAGGLQSFGTNKAITQLHDLFSLVDRGKLTVNQIGKTFEDVFTQLLPTAISKGSKLASAAFVELQQTALRHGLESPAIEQFRSQQIGGVTSGLGQTLGVNAAAIKSAAELQKQLDDIKAKGNRDEIDAIAKIIDLQKKLDKEGDSDKRRAIQQDINDLLKRGADDYQRVVDIQKELDKQQKLIAVTTIQSQAAATGFAGAILASFNELSRAGVPITEIFKQIGPNIEAFQQQLDRTGFTGGAAFDKIRELSALASDEIAGPALDGVAGLQNVLAGLANTGSLDAETFSGLAASVGDTFNSLVAQGKDGNQVLKLMAPTLQTIFELQERTGFAVDETTANLIAQAKAQGIVGEQFKSASERQVDGLNKIADILTAIATAFGVTLPDSAAAGAEKISDALGNIDVPDLTIDVGFNIEDFPTDFPTNGNVVTGGATGGLVSANGIQHFGSGGRVLPFLRRGTDTVPAMLTPGEIILTAAQQEGIASMLGDAQDVLTELRLLRAAVLTTTRISVDGRELIRVQHDRYDRNDDGTLTELRTLLGAA